ncbi:MAG: hypothetical protein Q7S35_01235 [Candidatus Limnocylindrales bacterium]|nr:hypothetical protein [Candidatus Limnocylindrales bacterium]
MDLVAIFLSGLGGAVVGSLLTYIGAAIIDNDRRTEAKRGAARALYFEVVNNAVYLRSMSEGSVPIRHVRSDTWEATLSQVASLLQPFKLKTVARPYFMAEAGRPNVDAAMAVSASTDDFRRGWADDADMFDAAAAVLREAGWSADEREDLAKMTEP